MKNINQHVGSRIRKYRKDKKITLQELAVKIHKSKSSVSKYENGEITLDIETLAEIASVLEVTISQLTDFNISSIDKRTSSVKSNNMSPFFQARQLYFYFYDGRYQRLKDGVIHIQESKKEEGSFEATLSICSVTDFGRSSEMQYIGRVAYSDMLIRFSFVNRYNSLEEDLLYIFNPLEMREITHGLLCGISSVDFMPCAFKCLVTLKPQKHTEEFIQQLLLTKQELEKWKNLNMLVVDNYESY